MIFNPNSSYDNNENIVGSREEVNFVKIDTNKVDKIDKNEGDNKNNNWILERSHTVDTKILKVNLYLMFKRRMTNSRKKKIIKFPLVKMENLLLHSIQV
jgi:hypothetical protein